MGNGSKLTLKEKEEVRINTTKGRISLIAFHSPELTAIVVSTSELARKGYVVISTRDYTYVYGSGPTHKKLFRGVRGKDGLMYVEEPEMHEKKINNLAQKTKESRRTMKSPKKSLIRK